MSMTTRQGLTFGAVIAALMALGWVLSCGGNVLPPLPPPTCDLCPQARVDGGGQ